MIQGESLLCYFFCCHFLFVLSLFAEKCWRYIISTEVIPGKKITKVGNDIRLECLVHYSGQYSTKWTYHLNKNLPENAAYYNNYLVLKNVQLSNSGIYSCEVLSNNGGIGKASGRVDVLSKT